MRNPMAAQPLQLGVLIEDGGQLLFEAGDGLEAALEFEQAQVEVQRQAVGGIGDFLGQAGRARPKEKGRQGC